MEEHFTEFEYDFRGLDQFQSLLTQFYMNYLILHIAITNFEKLICILIGIHSMLKDTGNLSLEETHS